MTDRNIFPQRKILQVCACTWFCLFILVFLGTGVQAAPLTAEQKIALIDSERNRIMRQTDSVRESRLAQYRKDESERVQHALQQTRDNMAAYEEKRAGKYGQWKWLAVLGRYVIIAAISGGIYLWKQKRDKSASAEQEQNFKRDKQDNIE